MTDEIGCEVIQRQRRPPVNQTAPRYLETCKSLAGDWAVWNGGTGGPLAR